MQEVYIVDEPSRSIELADISNALAVKIPQYPDCQRPIRQYVTQRYNRVVNRAVIDEMTKRFLVNGKAELSGLEHQVDLIERKFEESRPNIIDTMKHAAGLSSSFANQIQNRYNASHSLSEDITLFLRKVADRHQPTQKLQEATAHAARAKRSETLDEALLSLRVENAVPSVQSDRRVTLGGRLVQIKSDCIMLEDKISIA
jgi:hypothetical protein